LFLGSKEPREALRPTAYQTFEFIEDPGLEALEYHVVGALYLSVCMGVCHGVPIDPDMVVIIESKEFLPYELRVVVRDYGVWDSKAVDDVCEEFDDFFGPDLHDPPGLYPLGELVYGDKQVGMAL
jgi:hypothetical protein